jgi:glutamine amidotransferase
MISVGILDYGCGNVGSVAQAFDYLGFPPHMIAGDTPESAAVTHMVLPGVGTFEFAMSEIKKRKLDRVINRHIEAGKPFLGICVGMQVLMREGREYGTHAGLGVFDGHTEKLAVVAPAAPCPHIGWEPVVFSSASRFHGMNAERPFF